MLIKVIEFTIKFKIFDFHYPHILFCNFQNSVSEKMCCCLTFVCVYILIPLFLSRNFYLPTLAFYAGWTRVRLEFWQVYFRNVNAFYFPYLLLFCKVKTCKYYTFDCWCEWHFCRQIRCACCNFGRTVVICVKQYSHNKIYTNYAFH